MGSIVRRNGRYGVKVYRHGRYEWIGTFDTQSEARQVIRIEEAKLTSTHREKIGDFLLRWVEEYPRQKRSTQMTYAQLARRCANDSEPLRVGSRIVVMPTLQLGQVTRPIARAYVLKRGGHMHQLLRAAYNDALRDGLVRENPFASLGMKESRGRRDIKALTEEEVAHLSLCALAEYGEYGPMFGGFIMVAAYTGLRPSELYALEWDWIDFQNAEIEVRQRTYKGDTDTPKSNKVRRVILPPPAAEALRAIPRNPQDKRVFHGKRGGAMTAVKQSHYWAPVAARFEAALPPARAQELLQSRPKGRMEFYELRHACATILLERGVSVEDVALQLGHSDGGKLVRERYGHPSEDRARDRLRRAFDPKPPAVFVPRDVKEAANG